MDKFDFDTKTLRRAENVIRTILANEAGTDIDTLLPLVGFDNAVDAFDAAEEFGREANHVSSTTRRAAVQRAKKVIENIPPKALAAFERRIR